MDRQLEYSIDSMTLNGHPQLTLNVDETGADDFDIDKV